MFYTLLHSAAYEKRPPKEISVKVCEDAYMSVEVSGRVTKMTSSFLVEKIPLLHINVVAFNNQCLAVWKAHHTYRTD